MSKKAKAGEFGARLPDAAAARERVRVKRALRGASRAIANRIVGEGEVDPKTLKAHPSNWRTHSEPQREAMREILASVGWVQRIIVNKRSGYMIDGHLRWEEATRKGEKKVPVVFVDLDPKEERKMLALFDPIASMAGIDRVRLREVIADLSGESDGLAKLIGDLRGSVGLAKREEEVNRPEVQFTEELLEEHQYLVLYFENSVDWLYLQSVFKLPVVKSLRSSGRFEQVGVGRVVKGIDFLRKVRGEDVPAREPKE